MTTNKDDSNKFLHIADFIQDGYQSTFILGARGVGKTISTLVYCIKKAYNTHSKFIYLRRYQREIDNLGLNVQLLSDLTGLDIEYVTDKDPNGRSVSMIKANGDMVAWVLALNTVAQYKSNDYSNTFLIVYDEFIDVKNREIKGEVGLFLTYAETVFRDFSKFRALFLANATNIFNSYFIEWNCIPRGKVTKFKRKNKKGKVVKLIKVVMYRTSGELQDEHENSGLGMLALMTNADDPNITNNFDVPDDFVKKQQAKAKCTYIVNLAGSDYGLWQGDYFTISKNFDPSRPHVSIDNLSEAYDYRPYWIVGLSESLKNKHLTFSDSITRGVWLKAMKEKRLI